MDRIIYIYTTSKIHPNMKKQILSFLLASNIAGFAQENKDTTKTVFDSDFLYSKDFICVGSCLGQCSIVDATVEFIEVDAGCYMVMLYNWSNDSITDPKEINIKKISTDGKGYYELKTYKNEWGIKQIYIDNEWVCFLYKRELKKIRYRRKDVYHN